MANKPTQPTEPAAYTMRLCGDCSYGPPCRCSSDPAEVKREWISGGWVWVAHCTPKAPPA